MGRTRLLFFAGVLFSVVAVAATTRGMIGHDALARITFADFGQAAEPAREEHEKKEQRELDKQVHGDAKGKLRPDLFQKALKDYSRLTIDASRELPKTKSMRKAGAATAAGGVVGVQWTQIGPAPLVIDAEQNYQGAGPDAGEVPDLVIDPRNTTDQVIYAAFNDGGLWKSTNGGSDWKPKTDYMPSLSTGAVALDPANPSIVYVGTGNLYNNGYFKGIGVYRSVDGGDTWASVAGNAPLNGLGINKIAMPAANTLLVATNAGLFRSINSGGNFTEVPVGGTTGGFITDLDLDTQNSATTVYASLSGGGIFQSTDAGATFPVAGNLWDAGSGGPTAGNYLFVSFAQSAAPDGQTMYANAQALSGTSSFAGMWKSTDGGANWSNITAAANPSNRLDNCQCGYDQTIGVDPVDANKVYIGFQELWYSSDGGGSFSNISDGNIHWDHHALVFSPPNHRTSGDMTTRVWLGTDGGLHYTDDASSFTQRNGAIATNLFRAMDTGHGAGNNDYMVGGAQDTGTMHHKPSHSGTEWHEAVDADGGRTAVDWQDPENAFGISNGQFIRTTNGGDSWIRAGSADIDCVPMTSGAAVDPNDGDNVYVPGSSGTLNGDGSDCTDNTATGLFRSTDGGASFPGANFVNTPSNAAITFIATTPTDSNLMWVGLNNGQVAVSTDINATSPTFTQKSVTGRPAGKNPIGIAIDPTNTARVIVVYPGFNSIALPTKTKHVFETTDAGASWNDIGGTAGDATQMVPDLPITSVVIDPQTTPHSIIIASDLGVLRSLDDGGTWQKLGLGLPNVNVTSLNIDWTVTPSRLRAATYGRSAFELTTATGPLLALNCDLGFGQVDVGTQATRQCSLFNVGSDDLHVNSFTRSGGSIEFSIISGPPTPVTIAPGSHLDYTIAFAPTSAGDKTATFQINSDDTFAPAQTINASGTGVSGQIAIGGDLNFGVVPRGTSATKNLIVQNIGAGTLKLTSVAFLAGDTRFSIVAGPTTFPVNIPAGEQVVYTVQFAPLAADGPGSHTRTLRIVSNDPASPTNVVATGEVGVPTFTLSSTSLAYGGVPVDNRTTPHDKTLATTLTNQSSCGLCDLTVTGLVVGGANAADFSLVSPPALPYTIGAGNALEMSVNFNPSLGGARTATLTITTSDPVNPVLVVNLTGTGLKPAISMTPVPPGALIFGPTVFDPACSTVCGTTLPAKFANSGQAELIVDDVSFTGPFSGLAATVPPTRFQVGSTFTEQVTFHPVTAPARKVTGNLHVEDLFPLDPGNNVAADMPLCGESVGRGIRVLVVDAAGVPVSSIVSLRLQATGVSNPPNVNLKDLPLVTINPPTSCTQIKYHYENQALSTTSQTAPRGSYYTLTVSLKSKKATLTFGLDVNEFKQLVVTVGG
jgi:hypothetical protein